MCQTRPQQIGSHSRGKRDSCLVLCVAGVCVRPQQIGSRSQGKRDSCLVLCVAGVCVRPQQIGSRSQGKRDSCLVLCVAGVCVRPQEIAAGGHSQGRHRAAHALLQVLPAADLLGQLLQRSRSRGLQRGLPRPFAQHRPQRGNNTALPRKPSLSSSLVIVFVICVVVLVVIVVVVVVVIFLQSLLLFLMKGRCVRKLLRP